MRGCISVPVGQASCQMDNACLEHGIQPNGSFHQTRPLVALTTASALFSPGREPSCMYQGQLYSYPFGSFGFDPQFFGSGLINLMTTLKMYKTKKMLALHR
jgi:hypothetical protein